MISGGCKGDALRMIRGVYAAAGTLSEQFTELYFSVGRDPRVKTAEQRWSGCMQNRGYQYTTPRDLLAEPDRAAEQGQWTPEMRQRYHQAVVAARICGPEVGFEATVAQVRVDKEAAFVAAHKALHQHLENLRKEETLLNQVLPREP